MKVVLSGDWHANRLWARGVISMASVILRDEEQKIIIQLGDFGYWPRDPQGERFIEETDSALADAGIELWFVDGNHEDHDALDAIGGLGDDGWVSRNIRHLYRGERWSWNSKEWVAIGGGASVDRAQRTEGKDWFPQEMLSPSQVEDITRGGPADVVVAHDCPSSVRLLLPPPMPGWAFRDLARSDRHREILEEIRGELRPCLWLNGHYHLAHNSYNETTHMRTVILDCDGQPAGSLTDVVVDTATLEVSKIWAT